MRRTVVVELVPINDNVLHQVFMASALSWTLAPNSATAGLFF